MNEKSLKKKYNIEDEDLDEIEGSEENGSQLDKIKNDNDLENSGELDELTGEQRAEFFRKKSEKEKEENTKRKQQEKEEKERLEEKIKSEVLGVLRKGMVTSKRQFNEILVHKSSIPYIYRFNLIQNEIKPEIPELGSVLKKLRWAKNINFTIANGSHGFYIEKTNHYKDKAFDHNINWRKIDIPAGENEIYLIFKIPGSQMNTEHFLSSCLPTAYIDGFSISVNRKFNQDHSFSIHPWNLDGFFDEDKLILKCNAKEEGIDKILYAVVQIGRSIIMELLKLNRKYSESLQINNKTIFVPVIPIFRDKENGAFYKTKFNNVFRTIFDFPRKFENKNIYGDFSAISKELSDENFKITDFYDFANIAFEFQIKSFLSLAIQFDWVINPTKAVNYMKKDEEIESLINEYIQDIDTEKIIQDRLEEKNERNEFLKETMSNLLLTILGLSFLAQNDFRIKIIIIIGFVVLNVWFFYSRRKRFREKNF